MRIGDGIPSDVLADGDGTRTDKFGQVSVARPGIRGEKRQRLDYPIPPVVYRTYRLRLCRLPLVVATGRCTLEILGVGVISVPSPAFIGEPPDPPVLDQPASLDRRNRAEVKREITSCTGSPADSLSSTANTPRSTSPRLRRVISATRHHRNVPASFADLHVVLLSQLLRH